MRLQYVFRWLMVIGSFTNWQCNAQTVHPPERDATTATTTFAYLTADDSIFYTKAKAIQPVKQLSIATLRTARSWVGAPYVHGTLDKWATEKLVINLRQLDCWTYVEASLAVALAAKDSLPSIERYACFLQQLRYRNSVIDGYGSRIHYFSDWLLNADSLGYVKDITAELGGVLMKKKTSYMTDMAWDYPKLYDQTELKKVQISQDRINAHDWYFIPKSKVAGMENKIQDGDIIILTSSRHNLDVEHQGFAVRGADGRIHLMHASSTGKKVILSTRRLSDYLQRLPVMSGIIVARINN